jgi:hypothetical protein
MWGTDDQTVCAYIGDHAAMLSWTSNGMKVLSNNQSHGTRRIDYESTGTATHGLSLNQSILVMQTTPPTQMTRPMQTTPPMQMMTPPTQTMPPTQMMPPAQMMSPPTQMMPPPTQMAPPTQMTPLTQMTPTQHTPSSADSNTNEAHALSVENLFLSTEEDPDADMDEVLIDEREIEAEFRQQQNTNEHTILFATYQRESKSLLGKEVNVKGPGQINTTWIVVQDIKARDVKPMCEFNRNIGIRGFDFGPGGRSVKDKRGKNS